VKTYLPPKFIVERDPERCIQCQVCVDQCSFDTHYYDAEDDEVRSREGTCVGCHRCVLFCPTSALNVRGAPLDYRENYNWRPEIIEDIVKQAETGGVLLTGMGNDKEYRVYWDHLVLNASQVTNPSIDPLREPMELTTYIGRKPDRVDIDPDSVSMKTELAPQVRIEVPVMFSAMSYGAVSLNVHESLARAATAAQTLWNTGEGGLHPKLYKYGANTIVQVASGRFGVHADYLDAARIVEIKIGQGANRGAPSWRKSKRRCFLDQNDSAGDRCLITCAAARHLFHRGPGSACTCFKRGH
jgi:glutamate synthase domain-containing protein 2